MWNEEALIASKEIILCEALIDALTFWCAGIRHVTTSYGVNGFTDDHRAAFRKHGTKKIYIAYDRDDAGERAAQKARRRAHGDGDRVLPGAVPEGQGRERVCVEGAASGKESGLFLNKREWLGKGKRPTVAVIEPTKTEPKRS